MFLVVRLDKYNELQLFNFYVHHCILTYTSKMHCLANWTSKTIGQGFSRDPLPANMTPLLEASNLLASHSVEYFWHLQKPMVWPIVVVVKPYIKPLNLYYFAHCMYTNIAVWPHSPLQVISSTVFKSLSLKTEGDCIGWQLIINTNYHPMRD